jgi:hypothetical protein
LRHIQTHGEDYGKITEAVGRADWLLQMMMMSSTSCTLGFEHQGPILAAGHFFMGLLKKMGLAQG